MKQLVLILLLVIWQVQTNYGTGTGGSSDWSSYCSNNNPCTLGQGDCDSDDECLGTLVCGTNNCKDFHETAANHTDCCTGTGGPGYCKDKLCTLGQGNCDSDDECLGYLICGKNNCNYVHANDSNCCMENSSPTAVQVLVGMENSGNDLLFLGPGSPGTTGSEVLKLPQLNASSCSLPPHPIPNIYGYVATVVTQGTMVCGGCDAKDWPNMTNTCNILTKSGSWISTTSMYLNRLGAAAAWIEGNWWVTGGYAAGATYFSSTEIFSEGSWYPGVNLPDKVWLHCMVSINGTHIFMSGGMNHRGHHIGDTYIYTHSAGFVKQLDMSYPRYSHACALYKGDVWVAGGIGSRYNTIRSVEKFSLQSLTWTMGPSLPVSSTGGQLVEDAGRLLYIGGSNNQDIYEMQNNAWVDVGDLSNSRYFFTALKWESDYCSLTHCLSNVTNELEVAKYPECCDDPVTFANFPTLCRYLTGELEVCPNEKGGHTVSIVTSDGGREVISDSSEMIKFSLEMLECPTEVTRRKRNAGCHSTPIRKLNYCPYVFLNSFWHKGFPQCCCHPVRLYMKDHPRVYKSKCNELLGLK